MKPSELAKELERLLEESYADRGDSFDLTCKLQDHLPAILLALRHHEALVEALQDHGQLWDQLGYPFPSALAARKLLAQIEKEGGA